MKSLYEQAPLASPNPNAPTPEQWLEKKETDSL